MGSLRWTERDRELLGALAHCVPFLSLDQIQRAWWPGRTTDAARKRLAQLATHGMVWKASIPIHPELELEEPVVRWQPGQGTPDLGRASYQLRSRWTEALTPTFIFRATAELAKLIGGDGGRLSHELHATHDLHMGTVFLLYREHYPELVSRWVSEHKLAPTRRRQKLPDAALRNEAGELSHIIEFGGAYDRAHLEAFHDDCLERELSYEVW